MKTLLAACALCALAMPALAGEGNGPNFPGLMGVEAGISSNGGGVVAGTPAVGTLDQRNQTSAVASPYPAPYRTPRVQKGRYIEPRGSYIDGSDFDPNGYGP